MIRSEIAAAIVAIEEAGIDTPAREALVSRYRAMKPTSAWRPIGEAPDGAHTFGRWLGKHYWTTRHYFSVRGAILMGYTHYLPIPDPPGEGE